MLSLAELKARSRAFLHSLVRTFDPERIFVAWTGGKDSTVVLSLWREVFAEVRPGVRVRAVSIDTGCKFPEIVTFRDRLAAEWDLDLILARPGALPPGFALATDKVSCCGLLKITPLKVAIEANSIQLLLTGLRRDEHASRGERPRIETFADPGHARAHPLLEWGELDVWSYIMESRLPYCPLYDRGYRSLGCAPCTRPADTAVGERSGRDQDKEQNLALLRSLGYF